MRKHIIDEQVTMYLCGMRQEPPNLHLAYEIADHGETVIPLLLERLKKEKSETDQENLIRIFEVMSDKGYLRGRTDVVGAISDAVDDMQLAPIKEDSLEILKKIQISSGVKPFTYVQ